jgi:DNA-binding CsgD family transcriptional regulator/PAS domain-containing protein
MTDIGRFNDTIHTIYETILDLSSWPETIRKVVEFVGGHAGMIALCDPVDLSYVMSCHYGIDLERYAEFDLRYRQINPLAFAPCFVDVGGVLTVGDAMDYDEFAACRFAREWALPQRFVDCVCLVTHKDARTYGMVMVMLAERAAAEHREAMELVAPHLLRALHISRLMQTAADRLASFAVAIDALPTAVFMLDRSALVIEANPAGERLLAGGELVRRRAGHLFAASDSATRALHGAVRACAEGREGAGAASVPLADAGQSPLALVVPLSQPGGYLSGERHQAVAAVFVSGVEAPLRLPPELLRQRYALTPSELRIFMWIVEGRRVGDIADISGTSVNTVKTHIHRLLAKTGVRRQADLVRLVVSIAAPSC